MKFYRGLVDVGKSPVQNQIQRGYVPMTFNAERKQVQVAGAKPTNPMSAAEVHLLRTVHGVESVTELQEIGVKKEMSFAAERDRLEQQYGELMVLKVFGVRGSVLPREVEAIEPEPEGEPVAAEGKPGDRAGADTIEFDAPLDAASTVKTGTLTLNKI